MNPDSHTDPSNPGASRPIFFVSARLLAIQPPAVEIAICSPDQKTGNLTVTSRVSTTTPPTTLDGPEQTGSK